MRWRAGCCFSKNVQFHNFFAADSMVSFQYCGSLYCHSVIRTEQRLLTFLPHFNLTSKLAPWGLLGHTAQVIGYYSLTSFLHRRNYRALRPLLCVHSGIISPLKSFHLITVLLPRKVTIHRFRGLEPRHLWVARILLQGCFQMLAIKNKATKNIPIGVCV